MMYSSWGTKLRQDEEFCSCCGAKWSKNTSVTQANPGIRVALSTVDVVGEHSATYYSRPIVVKIKHVDTRNGPITIGTKHYV